MILMIDNYDSFTYNLVQEFRGLGANMKVVRNDEINLAGIAALQPEAIVFSPGPGNPDSAGVTLAAVKEFAGKMPLLGICLGHQSIAQAFGARIVSAQRLMHGKTSRIAHDGKGIFRGLAQGFEAMRYHSLAVERATLPDCFEVSATSEDGEIMGLRHKTLDIESVQYHPESIGTPDGRRQLRNFLDHVRGIGGGTADAVPAPVRKKLTARVIDGQPLTDEECEGVFAAVMRGDMPESELAALLTGFHRKGVTAAELAGAARAMRGEGVRVGNCGLDPVDIVGTGGDGAGTFNVSTTAAFIAAGAGVPVAKHGNGAATSKCGAADVLAALGVNLAAPISVVERCLREIGICFLFARNLHPAMKFAAPVRKALGFRTIFNLLGPLTNPAGARRHVIGVYDPKLAPLFAQTLLSLGSTRALVVCGDGNLDEISPDGLTFASELRNGAVTSTLIDAGRLYGASYPTSAIVGGDPQTNASLLLRVLRDEEQGACRAAAVMNAAAALVIGEKAPDLKVAIGLACESIDSGNALAKLNALIEATK